MSEPRSEVSSMAAVSTDPNDPTLTARLPVSAWVVIGNHLRKGTYDDVSEILGELYRQLMRQLPPATGAQPAPASEQSAADDSTRTMPSDSDPPIPKAVH